MLTPRDINEDQPPFYMPARYKLYIKCLQEFRNSNRFSRKPMPDAVREEFVRRSKEYQAYKQCEQRMLDEEANLYAGTQIKALEAAFFLPDYLMEEAWSQTGEAEVEQNEEFLPAHMYTDQLLRIMPREFTSKIRMLPAFEETLMKYDEKRGGDRRSKGGSSTTESAAA